MPLYCDKYSIISQGSLIPLYMCHLSQIDQTFYQIEFTTLETTFEVIQACAHCRNHRQTFETLLPGDRLRVLQQLSAQAGVLGRAVLFKPHRQRLPEYMHLADDGCTF